MSDSILNVEDLCWSVKDKNILKSISFNVKKGQFVGVIGSNGSGKTSLLRNLYRYNKPSTGRILLSGEDIWRQSATAIAKQISVVQQAPASLPYLVRDVVNMGLTPHKALFEGSNNHDREQVHQALGQVDLEQFANNAFDTLSGGEQQRVLIARAIVQRGQLLIMDEPTNHLDIHYQIDILKRVKQLGRTVIVSLHDLNMASAFCDHLILLHRGEIYCQGTPSQVLKQEIISKIYDVDVTVITHPDHDKPHLLFRYGTSQ
ncbi:MAG: ABC transporter ATP-binding protein [Psychrobium sp.]|nr:ABC transporter ATP-binding protein [Psychrobium sp.]